MSNNETRAATYCRSSKDRHEVSIDAQRRELLELATKRGLDVIAEYSDAVEAANDWNRPGFRRLLLDIANQARGWSTLLVLDTSRLARDVDLAGVFRHECRRRGVKVLFSKIPESNPLVDLITTKVYQIFDHIHSHMSREKGLAGMAENVRKGFRAGGRAPFGYELEAVETGAYRDGEPVTKSRLVTNADAPAIAAYLKGRAAGRDGAALARELGLRLSPSTLVGIEWRALTYAGSTVWNVERTRGVGAGGYEGGTKRRPRAEWILRRGTHEALISEAEAEAILSRLEGRKATRMRGSDYVLSGLLSTPEGRPWHGDRDGEVRYYRSGARRVKAEALERIVLDALRRDLASDVIVRQALERARKAVKPDAREAELRALQRRAAELERRLARVRNLLPDVKDPRALLPKLDELQGEKAEVEQRVAALAEEVAGARVLTMVTEADVRAVLARLAEGMEGLERMELKTRLRGLLERITVDPRSLTCCLYYAIPAGTGVSVASPRGRVLNPGVRTAPFRLVSGSRHRLRRSA
jgi:site-specific DNA recombinase